MVKSLIITGFGINCEVELEAAYRNTGAQTTIVHFNHILDGTYSLHDFDILNFPGGFSFGDDIASGKVMSNKIKYKIMHNGHTFIQEIDLFLQKGKYILGICNGFQILVQLGLLPDVAGNFTPETALEKNDSGKFEDRWVHLKVNDNVQTPFLKNINKLMLPVRHGEGKLVIKNEALKKQLLANELIALQYTDSEGNVTATYPMNPNGADLDIAGLVNKSGQVFGLMPHPEAFLSFYNHPAWASMQRNGKKLHRHETGQVLFDNIVFHIKSKR